MTVFYWFLFNVAMLCFSTIFECGIFDVFIQQR
nr:MAG TPA: hypothetical protein [Caudoviricetes sp.]